MFSIKATKATTWRYICWYRLATMILIVFVVLRLKLWVEKMSMPWDYGTTNTERVLVKSKICSIGFYYHSETSKTKSLLFQGHRKKCIFDLFSTRSNTPTRILVKDRVAHIPYLLGMAWYSAWWWLYDWVIAGLICSVSPILAGHHRYSIAFGLKWSG